MIEWEMQASGKWRMHKIVTSVKKKESLYTGDTKVQVFIWWANNIGNSKQLRPALAFGLPFGGVLVPGVRSPCPMASLRGEMDRWWSANRGLWVCDSAKIWSFIFGWLVGIKGSIVGSGTVMFFSSLSPLSLSLSLSLSFTCHICDMLFNYIYLVCHFGERFDRSCSFAPTLPLPIISMWGLSDPTWVCVQLEFWVRTQNWS